MLKNANVIPLHKSGYCKGFNNYRHISPLVSISKVIERVMQRRLYSYLKKFILLYDKQFGFRKKHYTIDAMTELKEFIRRGSKETYNITVILHLEKTCDIKDYAILLDNLKAPWVGGNATKLRKLSNKYKAVFIS